MARPARGRRSRRGDTRPVARGDGPDRQYPSGRNGDAAGCDPFRLPKRRPHRARKACAKAGMGLAGLGKGCRNRPPDMPGRVRNGSPTWIRTTIHRDRICCPAVRRSGIRTGGRFVPERGALLKVGARSGSVHGSCRSDPAWRSLRPLWPWPDPIAWPDPINRQMPRGARRPRPSRSPGGQPRPPESPPPADLPGSPRSFRPIRAARGL